MKTEKLIKNISDQIIEAQVKLGFAKETMRFYYPMESLNSILGVSFEEEEALRDALLADRLVKDSYLGKLGVSSKGRRFEITVLADGVQYVYENIKPSNFLVEIIDLFMRNHHCTIEDIENVFKATGSEYICEKMDEDKDFDYVLYFKDGLVDEYYYLIKMEMGHSIYHRFLKEDYESLL